MLCAVLVLSFCVAVAPSTTVVDKKLHASPLTTAPTTPSPQATPRTSTRLTTYTVPTTRQSTTTTTTADDVRPLSECAVPTFSMSLRSARNSSGVWTDELLCYRFQVLANCKKRLKVMLLYIHHLERPYSPSKT
ncbi:cell wall protein DAN4-like isoform X2 [Schistocerca piceifrons]|uniref:cell wall protein DAN4-like isoform X2 n=1 Tax=Schistocerca piceifrons TaxID=274613 RepID=UPI001F5ED8A0|nr:cell wall protein DAN4-like isoform X2 [Schistocerca piceifrons]